MQNLPLMNASTISLFQEAQRELDAEQVTSLALNLLALVNPGQVIGTLHVGSPVKVVSNGKVGTITKISRLRCFVKVEGMTKDLYVRTTDVEPV